MTKPMKDFIELSQEEDTESENLEFVDSSLENQLAEETEASAEVSGLRDEAATLADSELEDEANMPMEGQEFNLEEVLPFSDSDGEAGYEKGESMDQDEA